jgi:hypothetical protein
METTTEAPPGERPAADQQGKATPQLQPLDYAFQTLLQPLRKSLARIENHLARTSAATETPAPAAEVVASKSDDAALKQLGARLEKLSAELAEFRREAISLLPSAGSGTKPAPPVAEVVASLIPDDLVTESLGIEAHDAWEEILLGSELGNNQSLSAVRQTFLADVIGGVAEARALAGQLLLCQTSSVEEMPERFRHVGEAYYRWRPRTTTEDDPLEQALADWLTHRADEAGLRNSIQLVRPGDRFDSTRHAAATRGVEVVAVHGWVVLRDNQKVYTKASVTVQ